MPEVNTDVSTNGKQEDWMTKKWRPAMGWTYMGICILDMAIFPVLWSVAQVLTKQPITQWNPLTLQGAGLFHLAMGAVLGIAAFSRGQEKMAAMSLPPPAPTPAPSFSAPQNQAPLVSPTVAPAPSFSAPPAFSSSGKPMPVQPPHPEI
jgi:hypothetical protein